MGHWGILDDPNRFNEERAGKRYPQTDPDCLREEMRRYPRRQGTVRGPVSWKVMGCWECCSILKQLMDLPVQVQQAGTHDGSQEHDGLFVGKNPQTGDGESKRRERLRERVEAVSADRDIDLPVDGQRDMRTISRVAQRERNARAG